MIYTGIYNQQKLMLQCMSNYLSQSSEIKVSMMVHDKDTLFEKMKNIIVNVLIINLNDISHNDLDLIISIKMKFPKTSILIISDIHREDIIAKAIKAGAKGFLSLGSEASELLQAIYTIRGGHDYYSESITHILLGKYISNMGKKQEDEDSQDSLSSRQIEILRLWGDGMSNQEIADQLFISVRTVETHKNHIMQKLNLKSSVDLIKFAIKNNIIKL